LGALGVRGDTPRFFRDKTQLWNWGSRRKLSFSRQQVLTSKQPQNNLKTTSKQPQNNLKTTSKQPQNNLKTTSKQPQNNLNPRPQNPGQNPTRSQTQKRTRRGRKEKQECSSQEKSLLQ
jgi:hypothetical protein